MPLECQVRWVQDPSLGDETASPLPDALEFSVKVWYTNSYPAESEFQRVYIRTLRAAS